MGISNSSLRISFLHKAAFKGIDYDISCITDNCSCVNAIKYYWFEQWSAQKFYRSNLRRYVSIDYQNDRLRSDCSLIASMMGGVRTHAVISGCVVKRSCHNSVNEFYTSLAFPAVSLPCCGHRFLKSIDKTADENGIFRFQVHRQLQIYLFLIPFPKICTWFVA